MRSDRSAIICVAFGEIELDLAMKASDLVTIDPEILGGTPVFTGTRVPVKSLFEYLEDNYTLEEFLECFPTVPRELAIRVLECSQEAVLHSAA